jgi:hypothetical protein
MKRNQKSEVRSKKTKSKKIEDLAKAMNTSPFTSVTGTVLKC